ncbi:MAG: transglutaminaseTgpA domain-containing protein, partial [Acidimicrobiales bacterium]
MLGLKTVYDGLGFLAVAVAGAIVGLAVAWLATARELSPLTTVGVGLVIFVVGAGPAVPDVAIGGFLFGPEVPGAFLDGLIESWKDLLTTEPPVGLGGGLGVIPYVGGFVMGVGGGLLAWRTRSPLAGAGPGLVVLAGSILFGVDEPTGTLVPVQAGLFLVAVLAWAAHRAHRDRRSTEGIYWPRVWGSALMLALLAPIAWQAGDLLPFTANERTVLREDVDPPLRLSDYGSPLASLRYYRKDADRRQATFLNVEGLPKGSLIRVAAMDTYDGVVWTVSGDDSPSSGVFERVGSKILPVPPWPAASVKVSIPKDGYQGVWVPSVGTLRSVAFSGPDAESLTAGFRYNSTTGTAATMYELRPSDGSYRLDVRIPPDQRRGEVESDLRADVAAPFVPSYPEEVSSTLTEIGELAETLTASASSAYDKAEALEQGIRDQFYFSDDLEDAEGSSDVAAGHSVGRLSLLLEQRAGNAEQYAALMALMAQRISLPSRVVMGFEPNISAGGSAAVKGQDATAWVEIQFAEHGWVPFFPTPDPERTPPEEPPPLPEENPKQQAIPPPTYLEPPATVPPFQPREEEVEDEPEPDDPPEAAAAWVGAVVRWGGPPVLVIGVFVAAVLGFKALRRRRRRTRGHADNQIQGAWLEAVDRLRDMGFSPPTSATRLEIAGAAGAAGLWARGMDFARNVDRHIFGPATLGPDAVGEMWSGLESEVSALHRPLSRRGRLAAKLSLRSIHGRPPRPRKVKAAATDKSQVAEHAVGDAGADSVPTGPTVSLDYAVIPDQHIS